MRTTAAKERIEGELNVAREIQLGLVPKNFPAYPDHPQFDLFATLRPAREVGGDLYDFFLIDDTHLCFALGDVSDKGVPAALFMAITKTLIKNSFKSTTAPAEIMSGINDALSVENPRSMFVTLVIGVLNIKTGHVRYANGGHNPSILISADEGIVFKRKLSGPIVGAMEGMNYRSLELTMKPGDSLFLYTDGVNEAMDGQNRQFTEERLLSEIQDLRQQPADRIIPRLMERIKSHVQEAPQSDDIAMMLVRYNGNP